ncbi:hypothetical protein JTB14_007894 [Gonioctena quinquepunctata]|nr:hypothetical protein JTB14_007894 [Gonioctena quinquepunctata]
MIFKFLLLAFLFWVNCDAKPTPFNSGLGGALIRIGVIGSPDLLLLQCEKMVKPRVKKTTRGEIPQELYEQAAYDVINGNAKVRTTAKKYGMCHISLRRFVIAKKNNKNPQIFYREKFGSFLEDEADIERNLEMLFSKS